MLFNTFCVYSYFTERLFLNISTDLEMVGNGVF